MPDTITLSTGKVLWACSGMVSIGEPDEDGDIYLGLGYDALLPWFDGLPAYDGQESFLTNEDARSLSQIMIDRWTKFRDSLPP